MFARTTYKQMQISVVCVEFLKKIAGDIRYILLVGLLLRIAIMPFFADSNDFPFWTSVAFDVRHGEGIYSNYDLWYPPVWGYAIASMTPILDLFGCAPTMELSDAILSNNNLISEGWLVSVGAVVIIKIPLVLADILNGYIIYRIMKHLTSDEGISLRAAMIWTFCPLTIWVSAGQGQFETICVLFVLLAIWAYQKDSFLLSGMCVAAAGLTKITPILMAFPLFALIWVNSVNAKNGLKNCALYSFGVVAMCGLILFPQIINGEMEFVLSFLSARLVGHNPIPTGFDGTLMAIDAMRYITPSGSNVSAYSALSMVISLMITAFIFGKKRFTNGQSIMLIAASLLSMLMWFPAPGYTQYYVVAVGVLCLCTAEDHRFEYAVWAVTALAMICMLGGFTHAYTLLELGVVDADTLLSIYDGFKTVLFYPESIATGLKFVPVLLSVVLIFLKVRGEASE